MSVFFSGVEDPTEYTSETFMTAFYNKVEFSATTVVRKLAAAQQPNTFVAVLAWEASVQRTGGTVQFGPIGATITLKADGRISKFAYIGDSNTRTLRTAYYYSLSWRTHTANQSPSALAAFVFSSELASKFELDLKTAFDVR